MSQESATVRMSEIVPRAVTEETWRSMYVTRSLIAQYGKTSGCLGCESLGEKNGPCHSMACRQRLQERMSNTSDGKNKLNEEQKRRDAFTARRMMSASHIPVEESSSSRVKHERRVQPSKRARIASEAEFSNSTVMQDDTTPQRPPGADTTSEPNMRDSSKRQADMGVEELEQDTNNGGNEDAKLDDDVEMDVELQGEQLQGLSGVNIAKLKSSSRVTQMKNTTRLKDSLIMNTAAVCPVTGIYYDFSELKDRNRAAYRLFSEKPYVLITSPLNTSTSESASLNLRSKGISDREQITRKAREHLEFICKLIMIQHRNKRYFIHKHPDDASSWHDQCVQEVLAVTQAKVTKFDQCQLGLMNADTVGSTKHHGKRCKIMSTMPAIDTVVGGKWCQEGREHARSSGVEACDAHSYQMRKAIMSAIKLQRRWDARGLKLLATVEAEGKIPTGSTTIPEEATNEILEAWDEASGEGLDPSAVLAARRQEIAYCKEMKAVTKVPISQCCQNRTLANRSTMDRHQQWRSVQRQHSQQTGGQRVQQQKV